MSVRIKHPAMLVPDAMAALPAVGAAIGKVGIAPTTVELVNMRASQINGCAVCLEGGLRDARKAGESDSRLFTVAGWRETPYFTDEERSALALTEAVTRLSDRAE